MPELCAAASLVGVVPWTRESGQWLTPQKTFKPLEGPLPTPDRNRLEKVTVQYRSVD